MGGDLEHAVARRVEDRASRCAGAPRPAPSGSPCPRRPCCRGPCGRSAARTASTTSAREAVGVDPERRRRSRGRSSPSGRWRCPCPRSARPSCRRRRRAAGRARRRRWACRLPSPSARRFGIAHVARGQHVAEGVAALVAEGGRVGGLAHAEAVADDDDGAAERPAHAPASSQARAARRARAPRSAHHVASRLVAEPGQLALRVTHGLGDDITPRLRRHPSRRAPRPPPGGSRSRAAGAGPAGSRVEQRARLLDQAARRASSSVRALHRRAQRLARRVEAERRATSKPASGVRARAVVLAEGPAGGAEDLQRAHHAHAVARRDARGGLGVHARQHAGAAARRPGARRSPPAGAAGPRRARAPRRGPWSSARR